jgi:hypothetical protein
MIKVVLSVLVSTVALLKLTLVSAQNPNVGMPCKLKSTNVVSSQRMCVYVCTDKSIEGRFTSASSTCAMQVRSSN